MKTMHVVLSLGALVVALLGFGYYQNNTEPARAESSSGTLVAEESFYDFGTISMKDGDVRHDFILENTGEDTITIEKIYTSCMCTTAQITDARGETSRLFGMPGHGGNGYTSMTVAPGERITVESVFDPNAHGPSGVGLADRLVYLETNSQVVPKVELRFKAMVTR